MSNILIRDMEMPKNIEPGLVIEFADGIDGKRYARLRHYRHGGLTEWVEAISTVDARPMVHGEWHEYDDDYGKICCSVCEEDAPCDYPWNFCPNCGADMGT